MGIELIQQVYDGHKLSNAQAWAMDTCMIGSTTKAYCYILRARRKIHPFILHKK